MLEPGSEKSHYTFKTKDKTVEMCNPTKKLTLDSMNLLVEIEIDGVLEWVCISVSNIPEHVDFKGFDPMFGEVEETTNKIYGHDAKNKILVAAIFEESGTFVLGSRQIVRTCTDDDLTMAIVQRNSPGTSSFDVVWCFHKSSSVVETVFNKNDIHKVLGFCGDVTDNVFDIGPDPYDWKHFLKVQKNQEGDVDDWVGVFAPLTDEDDDDGDDDDEDYEENDESEEDYPEEDEDEEEAVDDGLDTDMSECSWSSGSESESDVEERPLKKAKH